MAWVVVTCHPGYRHPVAYRFVECNGFFRRFYAQLIAEDTTTSLEVMQRSAALSIQSECPHQGSVSTFVPWLQRGLLLGVHLGFIVFTPAYDSYEPAITLHKGITRYVQLSAPDFKINWKQVKKTVNGKTRMIILNSPHNPSGAILSAQDMKELEKIVKSTGIIVLSDEVYEHLVFDGQPHMSMALFPELERDTGGFASARLSLKAHEARVLFAAE